MARIRSVHPGLWTDETFVGLPAMARLFLIGLWNEADDNGVFQWKPLTLKMRILPGDNADASELLAIMEEAGIVMRYEAEGASYGAVRNFRRFQRPERPKPVHPITDEVEQFVALPSNSHTCSKKKHGAVGGQATNGRKSVNHPESNEQPSLDDNSVSEHRQNIESHGPMEEGIGKVIHSSLRSECESARKPKSEKPNRACRLPADWQPTPEQVEFARDNQVDPVRTAEVFRDYWLGVPGAKGCKADWDATWRNWVRREDGMRAPPAANGSAFRASRPKTAADRADEHAAYMLEKYAGGSR
ncbi:hypothetical protein [Gluconobacter oxydans]|uniref:hypothetical protein n=1 Tax=Gluconobacter oxydans TaxID=442 RepID=UPI000A89631A|nr:hypothetical protein [Gluconobacter oxydans]